MIKARKGGKIINIGSKWGEIAPATVAHYASAKGGVRMLTRTMALALIPNKINVNCIAPGSIWTPQMREAAKGFPDRADAMIAGTPIGRWAEPQEVARL